MTRKRLLPGNDVLRHWADDEGLTHQQIADRVFTETGEKVSRSTVSAAMSRAGIATDKARYTDEIPWQVKMEHIKEYPARMLRLLGRRRSGKPMTEEEERRLDSWLSKLEADHAVIGYDPRSEHGFYYIEKNDKTDGKNGVPIRVQTITVLD